MRFNRMSKWVLIGVVYFLSLLIAYSSWAVCPLITDSIDIQSEETCLLELNDRYEWTKEDISVRTAESQALPALSYGVVENADMLLSLPYPCQKREFNEIGLDDEQGFCDTASEIKFCLFEKKEFSRKLEPEIAIATVNNKKDPGIGQSKEHLFLVAFQELKSWAFPDNMGYIINKKKSDEHRNIWPASFATIWETIINFKLAPNIDSEHNRDDETGNDPALPVGGIIYSINKNFDVNLCVKRGLSISTTDLSLMTGVTFRF